MAVAVQDPELHALLERERQRQRDGIELIPSENYASPAVLEAMGSILTNKYSEGYPGRRYYGGNEVIDEIERLAQRRAQQLFGVPHVNVQPYSGSPANLAVYLATCQPGDVIMGQNLPDGGHLTHGWKVSATGIFYRSVPYHVRPDGYIDLDEVRRLAREHRPRLLWCGATAYVREFPFAALAEVADEVGAYFAADIAHVAGLVAGGVHPSPVPHAHIVTTTTHKTLRGPRGAMIMVTERGLARDPELAEKIDRAVFPGVQGGPHDHTTAAIAVALGEALRPEFRAYALIVLVVGLAMAGILFVRHDYTLEPALRHAFFQTTSIITGTGFASADFAQWVIPAQTLLVMLMFIGGSAGSVGGSIKVIRWLIIGALVRRELQRALHPQAVLPLRVGNKNIGEDVMRSVAAFITLYVSLFALGVLVMGMLEEDFVVAFSASAAAIGNVGPGLGTVGPMAHYGDLHPISKAVMIFQMWAGRIELIAVFSLFTPELWRRLRAQTRS